MLSWYPRLLSKLLRAYNRLDEANRRKGWGPLPRTWVPVAVRGRLVWLAGVYVALNGLLVYVIFDPTSARTTSMQYQDYITPGSDFLGWVMFTVGLISTWFSYCQVGRDRIAMAILSGFSVIWGLSYAVSWLFFGAPFNTVSGSILLWLFFFLGVIKIAQSIEGFRSGKREHK